MAQEAEQGIQKGDVLQKIAGLSLIIGGILLIVGNALVPRVDDPGDVRDFIENAADNAGGFTEIVFLLLAVGLAVLVLGFAGVYRSVTSGAAAAWVRLGFYGFIAGSAVLVSFTGFFGLGLAAIAEEWDSMAASADKEALFQGFTAVYWALDGAFSVAIVMYWGTMTLLFAGIVMSTTYPKWLGWAGLINAAVVTVIGFVYAFADLTQGLDLTFGIAALVSTIWVVLLGVVVTRKAW